MAKIDFYKILNIDQKANLKVIKSAYRQLALKYHPDHNPDNARALEMFKRVKEAYEVLTSPELRKKYDFSYTPSPTPKAQPQPKEAGSKKTGKNLRYNLYITLEDVARGCERSIRYVRKNRGEEETVQLKVKVPRGAFNQQRLKLSQYGDIEKNATGDLYVIIHLHNHPMFLKTEHNLRVNVPIRYIDAMLGSTIEVPTLTGIRKLKIKACEFEDLTYTMKGFGLPDPKGSFKGDLTVYCFIEHPKRLGTAEKNAVQKNLRTWPQGEMMQQYEIYLKQIKGI